MTPRQTVFTKEGLNVTPENLTTEDLRLMRKLKAVKVLCPYCLFYGNLLEFATFLRQKRGKHFISASKCRCPDCGENYMKKTLLKVGEMSMEEFGYWFWGSVFGKWSSHDRVSWDKFKPRLRAHFAYDDRQAFWDVYWEFKDARDSETVAEDREAFEEYKRQHEGKGIDG